MELWSLLTSLLWLLPVLITLLLRDLPMLLLFLPSPLLSLTLAMLLLFLPSLLLSPMLAMLLLLPTMDTLLVMDTLDPST